MGGAPRGPSHPRLALAPELAPGPAERRCPSAKRAVRSTNADQATSPSSFAPSSTSTEDWVGATRRSVTSEIPSESDREQEESDIEVAEDHVPEAHDEAEEGEPVGGGDEGAGPRGERRGLVQEEEVVEHEHEGQRGGPQRAAGARARERRAG